MKKKTKGLLIGGGALILTLGAAGGIWHLTQHTNVLEKVLNPKTGEVVATIENVQEDKDGNEVRNFLTIESTATTFEFDDGVKSNDTFNITAIKASGNDTGANLGTYLPNAASISDKEKVGLLKKISASGEKEDAIYYDSLALGIPQFYTKKDLPEDKDTYQISKTVAYFDTIRVNYSINNDSLVINKSTTTRSDEFEKGGYSIYTKDDNLYVDYSVMNDGHFYVDEFKLTTFGLGGMENIELNIDSIQLVRKDQAKASDHLFQYTATNA